jgi:hypothetical protein
MACAAKTRTGKPCVRRAMGNGRRNHGGLSSGPKSEAGRGRIAEAQRQRWGLLAQAAYAPRSRH